MHQVVTQSWEREVVSVFLKFTAQWQTQANQTMCCKMLTLLRPRREIYMKRTIWPGSEIDILAEWQLTCGLQESCVFVKQRGKGDVKWKEQGKSDPLLAHHFSVLQSCYCQKVQLIGKNLYWPKNWKCRIFFFLVNQFCFVLFFSFLRRGGKNPS